MKVLVVDDGLHTRAIIRRQMAIGLALICNSKGLMIGKDKEPPPQMCFEIRAPDCKATPCFEKRRKDWEQPRRNNGYKSKRRN